MLPPQLRYALLCLSILSIFTSPQAVADETESLEIVYQVRTDRSPQRLISVEATYPPQTVADNAELALPVWTPGSYKVRDYPRFLRQVRANDTALKKSRKNRWRLPRPLTDSSTVTVSYEIYGHDYSVRTNIFDDEVSLLVGAATFLAPAPLAKGQANRYRYRVEFPDLEHGEVWTGLTSVTDSVYPSFLADDYDQLIDGPFVWGTRVETFPFEVGGQPHLLVQAGDSRLWDFDELLPALIALFETHHSFWRSIPYEDYTILNLIVGGRGGLEHQNSTVLMTTRSAQLKRASYLGWLALVSHEVFHIWNVKEFSPAEFLPFDYETEVYTDSLWIAEGITSYYDDLLVRRAGLSTQSEYLRALSTSIKDVQSTPGRLALPLTEASYDAWIRLYQPTEDTLNSSVNYYSKGALVAWLLDTEIRRQSNGKLSLDDVMRSALDRFRVDGFTESEFRDLTQRVTGLDLTEFFNETLDSASELNFQPALEYYGLTLTSTEDVGRGPLGTELELRGGRWYIKSVATDSPGWRAGLSPQDEVIAVEGLRLENAQGAQTLIEEFTQQTGELNLTIARRGELKGFSVKGPWLPNIATNLTIERNDRHSTERRAAWLGHERTPD